MTLKGILKFLLFIALVLTIGLAGTLRALDMLPPIHSIRKRN